MSPAPTFNHLLEAARAAPPVVAIVLGSGMGAAAARLDAIVSLPFADVPGLEATGVSGHRGSLRLGDWVGSRVLVFEGRCHFYESGCWRTVTAAVQAAHFLGARVLLLTNAAGGIRGDLAPGTLMALRAHIDWTQPNAWRARAAAEEAASPYAARLRSLMHEAAWAKGIQLAEGVYAAVTGPCYETPAEVRALQIAGADAVGMSTVHEARAGQQLGMECAALSLITNRAAGLADGPIHHGEVVATAAAAIDRLAVLIEAFLDRLDF